MGEKGEEEGRNLPELSIARIIWDENPNLNLPTTKQILLTKKIVSFKIPLLQEH